ncbi:hypothetical protein [Ammoniphilus resinae]|uniref:hypothetical protein n=1 Tax=Ammoniphilus resinae TaxID=861532 RepID=UPI001AE46E8A|nr:hypothetical protein [Ammoniphilus resinae]
MERDKKVIEQSGVKFKSPYIDLMNQAIKKIEQDIIQNKKLLRQYGIRIYSENQTDSGIEVKYTFKNFHHLFNPSFDKIKSEVEKMMKEYLK